MVVHKFTNALIHETSPYLLQHAHNPVNWLPWSQEAFRLAKTQDKPIFLSIGYSTCHWCHVMEHESFENEKIAQIMNEHFVNIKVDREERPDVDKVYMNYVQAITGGGGWPLNVFLTPELSPFFGGTYFPPNDSMYGRGSAGFPSVLLRIAQLWRTDRKHVEESSQRVIDALREATSGGGRGGASSSDSAVSGEDEKNWLSTIESSRVFKSAIDQFLSTFDRVYGGFGPAPKFPRPVIFNFLFRMCHRCSSQQQSQSQSSSYSLPQQLTQVIEHCCLFTLEKMALGGMYDRLASGFHRYSVDREWHVPHFEKMIYDQAQLISSFVEACQVSSNKKNFFEHVARQVIEYMKRDMMLQLPQSSSPSSSSSSGAESMAAFYSAEDADSYPTFQEQDGHGKKQEGAFYAWSYTELKKLLEGEPIVVTESSPSSSTKQGVTSGSGRSSHSSNLFDLFSFVFNIKQNGNVSPSSDPHGELCGLNILTQLGSAHDDSSSLMDDALEVFSKRDPSIRTVQQLESAIDRAKCILLRERDHTRPRPHLDDKIIVSWNALMISALARASQVLQVEEAEYAQLGEQVARFIRTTLYNGEQKTLYRTCRYSKSEQRALMPASGMIEGFLSDYCFMVCGLLDLYEATGCIEWLQWAIELQQRQDELFLDNANGGYYEVTGHDESILLRMKEDYDGAEPSGNSTSAMNLLRLSQYRSEVANDLLTVVDRLFRSERTMIREMPHAVPQLLCALDERLSPGPHIAIVYSDATGGWASLAEMRKTIFARHMPSKTVFYMNVDDQTVMDFVRCNMPYLTDAQVKDGLPTAYVCQNFSCQAPVTDVSKLAQMLHGC